jgi:hypothetical protein
LTSAEDAAELVVRGIVDDRLFVTTDPVAQSMVVEHAADRDEFLRARIADLEGDT